MKHPKRTAIQKEIMRYILTAMDAGTPENYESLLVKLSYKPTYGALRVSIRHLEEKGMVERIRNNGYVEIFPTEDSYLHFRRT